MLQHLLKFRTSSTAASALSPKHSQDTFDDDYEIFSTPPSTPTMSPAPSSASSSFSERSSATSSTSSISGDANSLSSISAYSSGPSSRRNSRPTSLLIDSDIAREWTPDVQVDDLESPNVGKRDNGHKEGKIPQTVQAGQDGIPAQLSHSASSQQPQSLPDATHALKSAGSEQPVSSNGMPTQIGSSKNSEIGESSSASLSPTSTAVSSSSGSETYTLQHAIAQGLHPSNALTEASQAHLGSQSRSNNFITERQSHTPNQHSDQSQQQQQQYPSPAHHIQPKSPCFVHSFLEKGASLTDWLRPNKTDMGMLDDTSGPGGIGVAKGLQNGPDVSPSTAKNPTFQHAPPHHYKSYGAPVPAPFNKHQRLPSNEMGLSHSSSSGSSPDDIDDDEDNAGNLTRQLAETAVGVREMSKQLGRARVRSNIQSVLVITKARDNRLIKLTRELAVYLMAKQRNGGRGLIVYVDSQLRYSKRFDAEGIKREHPEFFVPFPRRRSSSSNSLSSMTSGSNGVDNPIQEEGQLRYWTSDLCNRFPHLFDFVVTLGGDGTVLFTSWLFQRIVPPVLPFALGSLGFLTNFDFADYAAVMDSAIENGIRVNLRMRFTCTVYRAIAPEPGRGRRAVKKADTGEILMKNLEEGGWEALEGGWSANEVAKDGKDGKKCRKDKEIMCFSTRPVESFEVLNDLVVDRGPSPYMSLLELFGDEHHMTTVQADGLTIATPTGSTAYSLSAGGSLVHPEIPAFLITPICPHTLSFRPMLLPDSMELRICVPFNSRSTAWASFDGRGRVELKQGDHIKVTASRYPFPTVCADKQSTDWFHAISSTLKWNERERQKSFVMVEEGPARPKRSKKKHDVNGVAVAKPGLPGTEEAVEDEEDDDSDEEEDEDEEEESYDIDDSSTAEPSTAPSSTDLVALEKAKEEDKRARDAAFAITGSKGNPVFRLSQSHNGIETPDRFVDAHPHPPRLSPRHVSQEYTRSKDASPVPLVVSGPPVAGTGEESLVIGHEAERGDRDHIHTPQLLSGGRSRIPRDRDVEAESMNLKTPTAADTPAMHRSTSTAVAGGAAGTHGAGLAASVSGKKGHHHARGSSRDECAIRRAFAVWGQDESDSATSDSDA